MKSTRWSRLFAMICVSSRNVKSGMRSATRFKDRRSRRWKPPTLPANCLHRRRNSAGGVGSLREYSSGPQFPTVSRRLSARVWNTCRPNRRFYDERQRTAQQCIRRDNNRADTAAAVRFVLTLPNSESFSRRQVVARRPGGTVQVGGIPLELDRVAHIKLGAQGKERRRAAPDDNPAHCRTCDVLSNSTTTQYAPPRLARDR